MRLGEQLLQGVSHLRSSRTRPVAAAAEGVAAEEAGEGAKRTTSLTKVVKKFL